MKITIATGIYAPEIGGPATWLQQVIPELKKQGWNFNVITYGTNRKGIITINRSSKLRLIKFLWQVYRNSKDSDVIFATDTFSSGFPAALSALVLRKKFVLRFVGDFAWEVARTNGWTQDTLEGFQKKRQIFKVRILQSIQKWVLRRADVFTVSKFSKRLLNSWGIKCNTVIYNSVEELKLADRQAIRTKLKIKDNFVIMTAARITKFKGVDKIIKTLSQVKRIPNLLFLVVGDGPAINDAKEAVVDYEMSKKVKFMGRLSLKSTRECMKASDLFVLNSEGENFSFTIIEAMSVKCPVIASSVGGNVEIVEGRGELFRYNNMNEIRKIILKFYNNENLRKSYAEKAYIERPRLNNMKRQVVHFFKRYAK